MTFRHLSTDIPPTPHLMSSSCLKIKESATPGKSFLSARKPSRLIDPLLKAYVYTSSALPMGRSIQRHLFRLLVTQWLVPFSTCPSVDRRCVCALVTYTPTTLSSGSGQLDD